MFNYQRILEYPHSIGPIDTNILIVRGTDNRLLLVSVRVKREQFKHVHRPFLESRCIRNVITWLDKINQTTVV